MTKKVNLAPFKLRTRKGWIWIENSETGTKGPELEATTQAGPVWVSRPKLLKLQHNSLHFFLDL